MIGYFKKFSSPKGSHSTLAPSSSFCKKFMVTPISLERKRLFPLTKKRDEYPSLLKTGNIDTSYANIAENGH